CRRRVRTALSRSGRDRTLGCERPRGAPFARRRRASRRRGSRQGVPRGRAGGNRGRAEQGRNGMIRVLAAAVVAMVVSIVVGPRFIGFLRANEFGQHIREEGPEAHRGKQGTPTMGGLLILVAATVSFLAVSKYKVPALTV